MVQEDSWHFKEAKTFKDALELPENPDKVLDMIVGRLSPFSGLFVLYQMRPGGPLTLGFLGYDEAELVDPTVTFPTSIWIPVPCPPSASSLASFRNDEVSSSLIVGGEGLYHYTAQEAFQGMSSMFRKLSSDDFYNGIKQLQVAQDSACVTTWALNGANELVYQQFNIVEEVPVMRTPTVPLLDESQGGGRFSSLMNSGSNQKLFTLGKEGQISLLMQDDKTRFWQRQTVAIPTLETYVEFQSYTTQVRVTEDGLIPIPNAKVRLSCTQTTELIINGKKLVVGSDSCEVEANEAGVLTIIVRADDLSTAQYRITKSASSAVEILGGSVLINPMNAVSEKLGTLDSGSKLKDLKDEDGSPVVDASKTDDKSMNDAASSIQELQKAMKELPADAPAKNATVEEKLATSDGKATQRSMWDFWPWLSNKIASATSWTIDKLEKGFKFVLKLAKGAWEFIVDTATKAYKALTKVFEAIGAGIKKLLKAIGDFFAWGDIIDTKNVLVNVVNLGMLWGHGQLDTLKQKTSQFFEDKKKLVANLDPKRLPPELQSAKVGKKTAESKARESEGSKAKADGPVGSFGSYQLDHGDEGIQDQHSADHHVGDIFGNLAKNLKTTIDKLKGLFKKLWENIKSLFKDDDVSLGEMLLSLGVDLAGDVLDVLQSIAVAIVEVLGDIFAKLVIEGNKTIRIPVLSSLYKKITGNELSLIDAMCLILAIPATLAFKAISGKKPKEAEGVKDFIQQGKYWGQIKEQWNLNDDGTAKSKPLQNGPTNTMAMKSVSAPVVPSKRAAKDMRASMAGSPFINMWAASPLDVPAKAAIKYTKDPKRLIEDIKSLIPFFKMIAPAVGAAYFTFHTFPGWFVDKTVSFKKGCLKTIGYGLLWFISIPRIPNDAEEEDDRQFVHIFGLSKVFTGFLPREFSAIIVGSTSFFQMITLVWLQIKTGVRQKGYSVTLAIEEWIMVLGKFVGSIASLAQGAEPISAIGGFALVNGGYTIQLMRKTGLTDRMIQCSTDGL